MHVTGGQGLSVNKSKSYSVMLLGYPAEAPFDGQSQYYSQGTTKAAGVQRIKLKDCPLNHGASGSPFLRTWDNDLRFGYVNSVMSYKFSGNMYGPTSTTTCWTSTPSRRTSSDRRAAGDDRGLTGHHPQSGRCDVRILVVGGSGLIGAHVVDVLRERGHAATTVARTAQPGVDHLIDVGSASIDALRPLLAGQDGVVYATRTDEQRALPADLPGVPPGQRRSGGTPVHRRPAGGPHPGVVMGSYYTYFDRLHPQWRLAERHTYIRCRLEQAARDGRLPARTYRSPSSNCPSSSVGPATGCRTGPGRWTGGRARVPSGRPDRRKRRGLGAQRGRGRGRRPGAGQRRGHPGRRREPHLARHDRAHRRRGGPTSSGRPPAGRRGASRAAPRRRNAGPRPQGVGREPELPGRPAAHRPVHRTGERPGPGTGSAGDLPRT
ncbi:NAD-dependent epimerase/dehydratase family protein [Micromonospora sp. M12]